MKDEKNLKKLMLYVGMLFLVIGFNSCSDDDDGTVTPLPTGSFALAGDEYTLTDNTVVLESITVSQSSWLTAVHSGNESTTDFIADPVRLEPGVNTNVELTFDEGAITAAGEGQQVVLMLFADNGGTPGTWDTTDQALAETETITVVAETSTAGFADFDTNGDGSLDSNEVPATYQNNFTEWDADGDGSLSSEEFYNTGFSNSDADDDDGISEEEWNTGFAGMFGNWSEDDFATYDADADGSLSNDEWNNAFAESQWFETYDADADTWVTEDEWNTGLFGDWDADDNDLIDEAEYDLYSPYVAGW
ncbi:hypothetical protein HC174_13210 [Salinimicrobium sp. CDJ15-81-2]|nr:hypothetical protein [Salinimicrobium nanhaiense]